MARTFCKNYQAMARHNECKVGIAYDTVPKSANGCPCWGPGVGGCDKAVYPTAEEMAAQDEETRRRLDNIGKARQAIVAFLGGPWKKGKPGASGAIACPVCGAAQSLRFSRAGYNGHIHAACSTAGCVSWME